MKNAMILFGIWIGIILIAYGLVYLDEGGPTPAQLALSERVAARTYVDPAGRFRLEVPAGWRADEIDDGVHLFGPIDRIEAWVLAVGGDVQGAFDYACSLASPCPGTDVLEREDLIPTAPARSMTRITYAADETDTRMVAFGYEAGTGSLVLLVRCVAQDCDVRASEVAIIERSLEVLNLEGLPRPPAIPVPVSIGDVQTAPLDEVDAPAAPDAGALQTESATPAPAP
jgi:hypothetical protein